MSLTSGTRLGGYEIVSDLGAGGMGEVYRARDTKLGRQVAVKVLPEPVAQDPDRVARFEREAKSLAALNHPHIATLFGMEQAEGRHFLVMELVEGETLAERIGRGPLPLPETLRIGQQIAEALETAHESGIVHRDLKPANVKLTPDDQVKVLDFGLAKALETSPSAANVSHSPTLSVMATGAGMILGTAAYMSPEQAKGLPADHRSDVFSFGSVLYEMLTGREAFRGETVADILASVLAREPDWNALPPNLNPRLTALLKRCLDKSRKQRWQAIGDVRAELHALAAEPESTPAPAVTVTSTPMWKIAASIVATAIIATGATAEYFRSRPTPPPPVSRFSIALTDHALSGMNRRVLDVSPDGSQIAYVANSHFYLRPINALAARPIPMSEMFNGPEAVVFSPDGQSLAFWARGDRTFKRMAVSGGAAVTLTAPFTDVPLTLAWHEDHIYFGLLNEGIVRIPENGGTHEMIVKAEPTESLYAPRVLPGGQAIMFTSAPRTVGGRTNAPAAKVEIYSLRSQQRMVIIPSGSDGSYVPSGHVVYISSGVMYAVPFDLKTLKVTGGQVPVVEGVLRNSGGQLMNAAFSSTGLLAYVPGPAVATATAVEWQLTLFDRSGTARHLKVPPGAYAQPRFSPDGKMLAFVKQEEQPTLWVHDLSDATAPRRVTFEGSSQFPAWFPDNERLAVQLANHEGKSAGIAIVRQDGSGTPEKLTEPPAGTFHTPYAVSPDGQHLLFDVFDGTTRVLHAMSLRDRKASPFRNLESRMPFDAQFSPDGRWVSYSQRRPAPSTTMVFVEPFPPTGAKYQVSLDSEDGHHAMWSRTGTELIYNPGPGAVFHAVNVITKPSLRFTAPTQIKRVFTGAAPTAARPHDLMSGPDGQPIFVGVVVPGTQEGSVTSRIDVVLNWFEELKSKLPAGR